MSVCSEFDTFHKRTCNELTSPRQGLANGQRDNLTASFPCDQKVFVPDFNQSQSAKPLHESGDAGPRRPYRPMTSGFFQSPFENPDNRAAYSLTIENLS